MIHTRFTAIIVLFKAHYLCVSLFGTVDEERHYFHKNCFMTTIFIFYLLMIRIPIFFMQVFEPPQQLASTSAWKIPGRNRRPLHSHSTTQKPISALRSEHLTLTALKGIVSKPENHSLEGKPLEERQLENQSSRNGQDDL